MLGNVEYLVRIYVDWIVLQIAVYAANGQFDYIFSKENRLICLNE
jgi:hypothetical protein